MASATTGDRIRESYLAITVKDRLPFGRSGVVETSSLYWSMVRESLLAALLAEGLMPFHRFSEMIAGRDGLLPFYLEAAQPAMYEIGHLWESGKITIAQEHRASARLGRLISELHTAFICSNGETGRAVVAAVTEEYHELGAWIVSDALEIDNWETRYLGANPPLVTIMDLVSRFRPDLLALSVTLPANFSPARALITAIRSDPQLAGTSILVGGQALNQYPDFWRELRADAFAPDVQSAVIVARKLRELRQEII